MIKGHIPLVLLFTIVAIAAPSFPSAAEPTVVGWVERAIIQPEGLEVIAKVDTGAQTSSLNAPKMKRFMRGGEEWVTFTVTNRTGKSAEFTKRIVRTVKIRRHRTPSQQRPVVTLGICLGNIYRLTEVNLVDRSRFNYQLLIGRRFLRRNVLVNPGRTFISTPNCRKDSE